MEQLDNIQVYDNINTKDAMKSALEKKSREKSAMNSGSRMSLGGGGGTDDSKTTSPLKRAKSAMMNKKVNDKRTSFTTDPRKVENLNVKRQTVPNEGNNGNDLNMRSPSRLTQTPLQKKNLRGGANSGSVIH